MQSNDIIVISQVNPAIMVQELIQAVENGYSLSACNQGQVVEVTYYEVSVFKNPSHPFKTLPSINKQEDGSFEIFDYDSLTFLSGVQWAVKNGYDVDLNSIYWNNIKSIRITKKQPKQEQKQAEAVEVSQEDTPKVKGPKGPRKPKTEPSE